MNSQTGGQKIGCGECSKGSEIMVTYNKIYMSTIIYIMIIYPWNANISNIHTLSFNPTEIEIKTSN